MTTPSVPARTHLFLFDIDGTLITSGGAGERALHIAVEELYGSTSELASIEIAGRTDRFITESLFRLLGLEPTPDRVTGFLDRYLHHLALQLPQREGRLMPGIVPLLNELRNNQTISLGLLTGNLERGAQLKLQHYGLWHYFEFGAYADDSANRNELGPVACLRARERHGVEFLPEQVYIIGDTEHDIACGRIIGARTVAVATGNATCEDLARHQPDYLYPDLGNLAQVLADLLPGR